LRASGAFALDKINAQWFSYTTSDRLQAASGKDKFKAVKIQEGTSTHYPHLSDIFMRYLYVVKQS
jgi:hypothetical protein